MKKWSVQEREKKWAVISGKGEVLIISGDRQHVHNVVDCHNKEVEHHRKYVRTVKSMMLGALEGMDE